MPERRDVALARFGEQLRRDRAARRRRRRGWLAAAFAGLAATGVIATLIWPPRPVLVWNRSASSPLGLYRVGPVGRAMPGDMVVAWPPAQARRLGAERRYFPVNVPLVKRVAAAAGDRVCAIGESLHVNGRLAARRLTRDPSGRPMPWWTGCEVLGGGDLLLLTLEVPEAFDGRYFGITRAPDVVGTARLIWRG